MRRRLVSDMKPTGRERRYRVAAGQALRDDAAALDEPAEDLGASPDGDRGGSSDRRAGNAPACGGVEVA